MGFRSTFITEHLHFEIPIWFIEKYPDLHFGTLRNGLPSFPISSSFEEKFYDFVEITTLFMDIQKILVANDMPEIVLVLLHECGGITRVKIGQNKITAREPSTWKNVASVTHDYCYGCSDENDMHVELEALNKKQ